MTAPLAMIFTDPRHPVEITRKSQPQQAQTSAILTRACGWGRSITAVTVNPQGKLSIAWNPVGDVQGYQIYRSTVLSGPYTLLATVAGPNTVNYTDTAVEKGITYYYKVALVGTYGGNPVYGEPSPAVSGVVPLK